MLSDWRKEREQKERQREQNKNEAIEALCAIESESPLLGGLRSFIDAGRSDLTASEWAPLAVAFAQAHRSGTPDHQALRGFSRTGLGCMAQDGMGLNDTSAGMEAYSYLNSYVWLRKAVESSLAGDGKDFEQAKARYGDGFSAQSHLDGHALCAGLAHVCAIKLAHDPDADPAPLMREMKSMTGHLKAELADKAAELLRVELKSVGGSEAMAYRCAKSWAALQKAPKPAA